MYPTSWSCRTKTKSRKFPPTLPHRNRISRPRGPRLSLPPPKLEALRLCPTRILRKKTRRQALNRQRIAKRPTAEKAVKDAEIGEAVAAVDVAESACRNPSLPGQLRSRRAAIARNGRIARSETSALNSARRRAINPCCCPGSRSQNINV